MTERTISNDAELSPEGLEALLRLLVTGGRRRISSAVIDGRTVWIKRFAGGGRHFGKWLHAALTPVMPRAFLRASLRVGPTGKADREVRKTAAFRQAGFPALHVLHQSGDTIVLSNAGAIVRDRLLSLRTTDAAAHDDLLVACADALARVHAAGLCHGRPHPRDMFIDNGVIGFLDFEEEPEAVMPLEDAQARDVWLLFQQIVARAIARDTSMRAFNAYRRLAPAATMIALRSLISFFTGFLPLARAAGGLVGDDGRRFRDATAFLKGELAADAAARPHPTAAEFRKQSK